MKDIEQEDRTVTGRGSGQVEGEFTITITHGNYTADEVAEMLASGELSFDFGDTRLFDEAGNRVGEIDWHFEENSFEIDDCSLETGDQSTPDGDQHTCRSTTMPQQAECEGIQQRSGQPDQSRSSHVGTHEPIGSGSTGSTTQQKQLGQWNVVRQTIDGRWDLVAIRQSMKGVIRYRNSLVASDSGEGLRICDSVGD